MTDGGTSMRKFRVSRGKIKFVIGSVITLVILLAGAVVTAYLLGTEIGDESGKIEKLTREIRDLRDKVAEANGEVRQIQAKVSSFSTSLDRVSEYARRLRRFTH